ncbi:CbtA family protein [Streptomyces sp. NPDC093225]|uniref:CbtA family protein n=1 Tax=Streptomyces sp. NPDC093225 TaxID=3366034 RepID=UPI00382DB556
MNSVSVRALLVRGMLAGLVAGVLSWLVSYFLGESKVDAAIAFEEAHEAAAAGGAHEHAEELVSRTMQATAGLGTAVGLFSIALGGIAALVFCFVLGRIGRFGVRATAALTAGGAFVAVSLVPFLKYPANPPAVGDPDTVGKRTTLYVLMIVLSLLLSAGAVILGRRLAPRLGNWNASVVAGAVFVVAIGLAFAFLPAVNEVPADFPATLIWQFRMVSLAIQATMWTAFGLVFGVLAERVLTPAPAGAPAARSAAVPS